MGFSIANTSSAAVITKIGTPSSVTGDLTITGGALPLTEGGNISGTNTIISEQKGSPNGTIQMFLKQGDAKIDTFVNNTLFSSKNYSSGIVPVLTPVLDVNDSLTMLVSDPQFDCYDFGTGFNNEINKGVELSDGKLIMVGSFTTYKGVSARRIVRLNADMSRDTTFDIGTGFSHVVNSVAVQSDDKILCGGNFTSYKGTSRNRLVRLNTDGSLDTTFNIGTGFNSSVLSITIQPDQKILVGGAFITYSGVSYQRLIRLNTNGSIDTTFVNPSISSSVYEIGVQSNGKIVPVGEFTSVSGVNINGICRLSSTGLIEQAFNPILSGDSPFVYAISIQSDSKIVIGGLFDTVSGTSSPKIARLLSGGTRDTSFEVGTGFDTAGAGNNAYLSDISLSQGKYLVSGIFNEYSGASVSFVVRLNTNGSIDTTFNQGTGFTVVDDPLEVINFSMGNGNIVIGNTQGYNGEVIPRIAILTPFGGLLNCE